MDDLETQARRFADETSSLLNQTVAHGVRISALRTPNGRTIPVGGKRFRPTLEDLIEFMVTEEMVVPRPQWQRAVNAGREDWSEIQLKAATRRNPAGAAEALAEAGWQLTPPPPDQ